jgi:hypothetical protein
MSRYVEAGIQNARIVILGGDGMPIPAESDDLGHYVFIVVKSNGEMTLRSNEENTIALVSDISRAEDIIIDNILKVYESGNTLKMSIEFTGGKLKLVQVPSCYVDNKPIIGIF